MIRGIHHTAISTGNMDRQLAFYRDLLGRVLIDYSWGAGTEVFDRVTGLQQSSARCVMLHAGNAFIELWEYASPTPSPGDPDRPVCNHGITHICLDVTDLDAEYQRLRVAGMRFHCPPQELGSEIRTTYGRDPDGNVIELQEVSQDSGIALPLH